MHGFADSLLCESVGSQAHSFAFLIIMFHAWWESSFFFMLFDNFCAMDLYEPASKSSPPTFLFSHSNLSIRMKRHVKCCLRGEWKEQKDKVLNKIAKLIHTRARGGERESERMKTFFFVCRKRQKKRQLKGLILFFAVRLFNTIMFQPFCCLRRSYTRFLFDFSR